MKQNWEKRFDKKFIDYIDHEFVISNNKPITIGIEQLKAFIKQELEDIFSKLPSKDDPLSREEMLDIIEEQRRKVGLG